MSHSRDLRELFTDANMIEQLSRSKHVSSLGRDRLMMMITSRSFIRAVISPRVEKDEKAHTSDLIVAIYDYTTRPSIIRAIARYLEEHSLVSTDRDVAVFFVSLVNLGMSEMNTRAQDIGNRRDHRDINDEEYDHIMRKFEQYQEDLETILAAARKIIRPEARMLNRSSGIPKKLCQSGLYTVPSENILDAYKIGYYLDLLLNNIYGFVDMTGGLVDFQREVNWSRYFARVFGARRLPDVASLIMLESPDRITQYKNQPAAVRDCWDSLTEWALRNLNSQSSDVRDHMIELFLKRVSKRLDKWGFNTRIDLRKIDDYRFSDLAHTVKKYWDRLDEMAEKAAILANASRDTSTSTI